MASREPNWLEDLRQVARSSKATILGLEKVVHTQHSKLVRFALQAFGDEPLAVFFIEILPPSQCFPRPDLIIIHPRLGVLVIENKGVELGDILSVEHNTLAINRNQKLQHEDPFFQAERVMFALKHLVKSKIDQTQILFNRMVSLPAISRAEFEMQFTVSWEDGALFAEDFSAVDQFRSRLRDYCESQRQIARRPGFWTRQSRTVLVQVLQSRGALYSARGPEAATDASLLGGQIHLLETSLKHLTPQQLELMKLDIRGQHRLFRGVAGSGKSLLLAALAARLMVRSEEDSASLFSPAQSLKVLAVCYNRTLVHHLRGKIEEEYRRLAWHPATTQLPAQVTHFHGLLRTMSDAEPSLRPGRSFDLDTQRTECAVALAAAFDRLDESAADKLRFDAIFIDETQDLEPEEIQLLLKLARKDPAGNQTFVIFYDNAQNIYGVPAPVWESLGVNIVGRTTFMDKCMRNTRETIELAFNVLVGSYAAPQVRVTTRRFADVASLRDRDLILETENRFNVMFASRSGPMPEVKIFNTGREERAYALETIRSLWQQQKVLPSDILILYPSHPEFDALKAAAVELIAEQYAEKYSVRSVNKSNEAEKNLPLIQDRTMTLCTIHSAKGYDAPVVILLGADLFSNDTKGRASFYVAATRAKIKLYVFGVKSTHRPALLLEEIAAASAAFDSPSAR